MDASDRTIIESLAGNSRASLAEIGAAAGLSPSAVNERIRRLREAGAIRRFTVDVEPAAMGHGLLAFVAVELAPGADEAAFRAFAAASAPVEECHHVTGAWSYLLKVRLGAIGELEALLASLKAERFLSRSETMIVLSSPVPGAFVPGGRP